jgi:hypothetical protein
MFSDNHDRIQAEAAEDIYTESVNSLLLTVSLNWQDRVKDHDLLIMICQI